MNLSKMFEMQKELDNYIIKTKGLEGQDLLPNTILALQVELGECCNEWRGFKHWSEDKEPRTEKVLVEYVDCLHFILSIGLNEYEENELLYPIIFYRYKTFELIKYDSITVQFNRLFDNVGYLDECLHLREMGTASEIEGQYEFVVEIFLGLGEMLGFTWEQIEQAYTDKWNINKQRQTNGY